MIHSISFLLTEFPLRYVLVPHAVVHWHLPFDNFPLKWVVVGMRQNLKTGT